MIGEARRPALTGLTVTAAHTAMKAAEDRRSGSKTRFKAYVRKRIQDDRAKPLALSRF